jgi:hypothetical protein
MMKARVINDSSPVTEQLLEISENYTKDLARAQKLLLFPPAF